MSRFYDRLMASRNTKPLVKKQLAQGPVIEVTNIHNYVRASAGKKIEFVALAPPFETAFFEYLYSDAQTKHRIPLGLYFSSAEIGSEKLAGWKAHNPGLVTPTPDTRWMLYFELYRHDLDTHQPPFVWTINVGEKGEFIHEQLGATEAVAERMKAEGFDISTERGLGAAFDYVLVPLMAINFMHCSNVVVEDNPPPTKLSKKHEKRYGTPLVTFKTLKIRSMRKESESTGTGTGSTPSLHIARGHFKDFRDGDGLFGKYQGVYWWDAQVRGSAKKGVVVKDYTVEPPMSN